jgi:L-malate glycosyltransferase
MSPRGAEDGIRRRRLCRSSGGNYDVREMASSPGRQPAMKTKILFISRLFPENADDRFTSRALLDFMRYWNRRADVLVVRPRHYNPLKRPVIWPISLGIVDGIPVHTIAVAGLHRAGLYFLLAPLYFLFSRRFNPDIVVAHRGPDYFWARRIARRYSAKFVIGLHGSDVLGGFSGNRRFFESADLIACRSPAVRAQLLGRCPSLEAKSILANSGIPSGEILPEPEFERKADDWEGTTNFITVAKLQRLKNIDCAIESLARLSEHPWTYTIVGDGPEQARLERLVEARALRGRVRLIGYRSRAEVLKMLPAYNVFLMPSAPETFGLAYLEAMAKGCIPVCSKGWGVDGIIEDGYDGFTVVPGSVDDLESLLRRILGLSGSEKSDLLKRARATISEYTEERVALDYLNRILALS